MLARSVLLNPSIFHPRLHSAVDLDDSTITSLFARAKCLEVPNTCLEDIVGRENSLGHGHPGQCWARPSICVRRFFNLFSIWLFREVLRKVMLSYLFVAAFYVREAVKNVLADFVR